MARAVRVPGIAYGNRSSAATQLRDQSIVFGVRPNPEPHHVVTLTKANGSIAQPNTNREDGTAWMNLLELKARMKRVVAKRAVRPPRCALDSLRQLPERFPEAFVRVGVQRSSGSNG